MERRRTALRVVLGLAAGAGLARVLSGIVRDLDVRRRAA
jgi:hypothetical protein